MRKVACFLLVAFSCFSCSKQKTNTAFVEKQLDHYFIDGHIENYNAFKVFLYANNDGIYQKQDSFLIQENHFYFKGIVERPERVFLSFEKKIGQIPLVLSNDSIQLSVSLKDLNATSIIGSKLTTKLLNIRKKSAAIFSEIDYLYPKFQKARLENDSKQLLKISEEIKAIESKNKTFLLNYARTNPSDYLAAIILHDIIVKDTLLQPTIEKIYATFSSEVKQSKEAQIIAKKINHLKN